MDTATLELRTRQDTPQFRQVGTSVMPGIDIYQPVHAPNYQTSQYQPQHKPEQIRKEISQITKPVMPKPIQKGETIENPWYRRGVELMALNNNTRIYAVRVLPLSNSIYSAEKQIDRMTEYFNKSQYKLTAKKHSDESERIFVKYEKQNN